MYSISSREVAKIPTKENKATHLAHRIRILLVQIPHHSPQLPLKHQLPSLLKVQPRRVDHRKKHPVEPRLADLDTRSLDGLGGLRSAAHEAVDGDALVLCGGGRDVCGVEEETKEGGLAGSLAAYDLLLQKRLASKKIKHDA